MDYSKKDLQREAVNAARHYLRTCKVEGKVPHNTHVTVTDWGLSLGNQIKMMVVGRFSHNSETFTISEVI